MSLRISTFPTTEQINDVYKALLPIAGHITVADAQQVARILYPPQFDPRQFICAHCQEPTGDRYMVNDNIWRRFFPDDGPSCLHLECIERKLGRSLELADFAQYAMAPINRSLIFGLKRGQDLRR